METFYNELHSYVQKIAGQIVDLNGGNPVVTGVVTQALGTYYVVKLIEGDSESSVKAITVNNNLNLSLNDSVYLIKANSTLDSAYYIIGKMESIQEAFLNLTLAERFQAVDEGMTIALNTDIKDSTIIDDIKEKGAFQISGTFTCQKNTDDYGVKVTLYNGSAEIKSYELNTHYFIGQPFNMIDMVQSRTIQLDETTLNSGFNKIKVTKFGDGFSCSNVKLSAGFLLNIDGVIKVAVAAVNDKDYFSKVGTEFENTVQLKATVTYEGQEFAANGLQYYWLIKDDNITSASKEYLDFVGDGWKCLNSYTEVVAVGIKAKLQLWDNKNSIVTFSDLKDFPNFINTMKCVIKYQQVIAESEEFEIYNYNKESFYVELESNFTPAQIIAKEDRIQLTCKIKDKNEQSDIDVYDTNIFQIEYNWFYRPAKSEDEQGNNIVWGGDWQSISEFTDAILFIKDDNIIEDPPTAFELSLTHDVDGEEKEYINYQFYCQVKISKKEEDGTVSLISTEITDPIHVITKIQAETTIHAFDYYKYCLSTSMSESFLEKEGGSVAFLKTLDKQIYSGKIYYKQASTGSEEDTELGENALFYTEVSEPTVDELNLYYERFKLDKDWIRNSNNLTLIKNLQYEKIAEQNTTGYTYSFSLENDVYTIKSDVENHNSYYIVEFTIPADINVLKINYQQSSEVNYDYAFFSKINTALTKGTGSSDTNSIANTKGITSGTIVYDLSSYSEDITIQIKFRRDYSGKGGTNSISFSFYADYVFKDWVKTDPVINETAYNYISENFEDIFTSSTIPAQSNPYLYYTRQTIWFEERNDIYFFLRVDGYSMPVILRQVGLDSSGNSTNIKYGNSISQINTFNQLTQYGKEEGIFYQDGEEGDNHLYINASFINTGVLRVGDANNERFYASLDEDEVKIAGFTVDENSLWSGDPINGPYVKLSTGGLLVKGAIIEAPLVQEIKIYYLQNSSASSKPKENDVNWSSEYPEWTDGKYIWQKTETYYANDLENPKMEIVCLTGAKGATGQDGYTPIKGVDYFDGTDGDDGTSIIWKGEFSQAPVNPENGWAYYNSQEGASYVYQNGAWYQMSIDGIDGQNGSDGLSIVWKGELSAPPTNPEVNWAYKDIDDGKVFIYNGVGWELMVVDGSDGEDGADGADGLSVYIIYHDNVIEPPIPTGDGTTNGWHTDATKDVVWMSQKVSTDVSTGDWGAPIKIKGENGTDAPYIVEIIEQYFLSESADEPFDDPKTIIQNDIEISVGQWVDITIENSTIPIVKGYLPWRRQKYEWNEEPGVEGAVQGEDGSWYSYSASKLDATDKRIVDWCAEADTTLIDGGNIFCESLASITAKLGDVESIEPPPTYGYLETLINAENVKVSCKWTEADWSVGDGKCRWKNLEALSFDLPLIENSLLEDFNLQELKIFFIEYNAANLLDDVGGLFKQDIDLVSLATWEIKENKLHIEIAKEAFTVVIAGIYEYEAYPEEYIMISYAYTVPFYQMIEGAKICLSSEQSINFPKFQVDDEGRLTATDINVTGIMNISNNSTLGGFTVVDTLESDFIGIKGEMSGFNSDPYIPLAGTDIYTFWAGSSNATTAPFKVSNTGGLYSTKGKIGGFDIYSSTLIGSTKVITEIDEYGWPDYDSDGALKVTYEQAAKLIFNYFADENHPVNMKRARLTIGAKPYYLQDDSLAFEFEAEQSDDNDIYTIVNLKGDWQLNSIPLNLIASGSFYAIPCFLATATNTSDVSAAWTDKANGGTNVQDNLFTYLNFSSFKTYNSTLNRVRSFHTYQYAQFNQGSMGLKTTNSNLGHSVLVDIDNIELNGYDRIYVKTYVTTDNFWQYSGDNNSTTDSSVTALAESLANSLRINYNFGTRKETYSTGIEYTQPFVILYPASFSYTSSGINTLTMQDLKFIIHYEIYGIKKIKGE